MLPWQEHLRQLNYKKKPTFLLLTCLLPFLAAKGSRALEKKVNETQVSKAVFSHLNQGLNKPAQRSCAFWLG